MITAIFLALLTITVPTLITLMLISSWINRKDHKTYRKGYYDLITCEVQCRLGHPSYLWFFKYTEVIWFEKGNDFKTAKDTYLINYVFTWFDPYALYWLIKYQRAARKLRFQDYSPINITI